MSELLFESPVTVGVVGAILTGCAVMVWIKVGHRAALYASAGLAILTVLLVMLNLQVQTDREQIDDVMQKVANAVERNDLDGVLAHVYPNSAGGIQRAKTEFPSYKFTSARITRVKSIDVDKSLQPPSAVAEIFVSVSVTGSGVEVKNYPRFVRVFFLREGDKWRVSDYEHFAVSEGFRGLPGDP